MVSALESGASGPSSSPGRGHCVVFDSWTIHFTLTVLLSAQVYKWAPAWWATGFTFFISWSFLRLRTLKFGLFCYQRSPASPRSSRPKSTDFVAFVGPWPPARSVPFYKMLYSNRNEKLPNIAQ